MLIPVRDSLFCSYMVNLCIFVHFQQFIFQTVRGQCASYHLMYRLPAEVRYCARSDRAPWKTEGMCVCHKCWRCVGSDAVTLIYTFFLPTRIVTLLLLKSGKINNKYYNWHAIDVLITMDSLLY